MPDFCCFFFGMQLVRVWCVCVKRLFKLFFVIFICGSKINYRFFCFEIQDCMITISYHLNRASFWGTSTLTLLIRMCYRWHSGKSILAPDSRAIWFRESNFYRVFTEPGKLPIPVSFLDISLFLRNQFTSQIEKARLIRNRCLMCQSILNPKCLLNKPFRQIR